MPYCFNFKDTLALALALYPIDLSSIVNLRKMFVLTEITHHHKVTKRALGKEKIEQTFLSAWRKLFVERPSRLSANISVATSALEAMTTKSAI